MTTVAEVVQQTRRHLHGTHRSEWNRLAAQVTDTATTIVFGFPTAGIAPGTYLGIDAELVYVWEVDKDTRTATVQRGVLGSTPAAHSANALIEVAPRFPDAVIVDAIKTEIRSWVKLFAVGTGTATVSGPGLYVLPGAPTDVSELLDVRFAERGYTRVNPAVCDLWADAPGGPSLVVRSALTGTLHLAWAEPFDLSSFTLSTDLTTLGLAASMEDIPAWGAAARLVVPREVPRTELNSASRLAKSDDVPPGHILQTGAALKRVRDERLEEEASRLRLRFPYRGA